MQDFKLPDIANSAIHPILAFITAAFALLATPGPATLALAASGAAFGMKKSIKFYNGVIAGLTLSVTFVASGLYLIVINFRILGDFLTTLSVIYLVYLSYCIATAPPINDDQTSASPGFATGFVLGITNLKAYIAFAALLGSFTLGLTLAWETLTKAVICMLICIMSDFVWLFAGSKLRKLFVDPIISRILNISFATLMIVTIAWSLT